MRYKAVMFDLDGTLADTLLDIAEAGNHMLRTLGHEARPVGDYRYLAGQGLPYLVKHALGPGREHEVEEGIRVHRAYYAEHGYDHTSLFSGIAELLDELQGRGVAMAVLSNKPHDATVAMVERLLGRWEWAAVRGHRDGGPLKPDAAAALEIAEEVGVPAEQWVYVGDTSVDMKTGKAAGFYTIGVTWGFRDEQELRETGADVIVREAGEVLGVVDGRCAM